MRSNRLQLIGAAPPANQEAGPAMGPASLQNVLAKAQSSQVRLKLM